MRRQGEYAPPQNPASSASSAPSPEEASGPGLWARSWAGRSTAGVRDGVSALPFAQSAMLVRREFAAAPLEALTGGASPQTTDLARAYGLAQRYLSEALQLDTASAETLRNLAVLAHVQGDDDRALKFASALPETDFLLLASLRG